MSDPIAMITAAMRADAEAVRIIAQNVANASTAGYRRAVPHTVQAALDRAGLPVPLPETRPAADFTPGALESTGGSFDLAIEGPGFFVVATPRGEQLTRRGDFRLSSEGYLVTQLGDLVLGRSGAVLAAGERFEVAADGTLSVDGAVVDRLRVVDVPTGAALEPSGRDGYVAPADSVREDAGSTVRQGFLEGSNVAPVAEMMRLMEAMRHFETAQRFARGYDDMLSLALSQLGRV